MRRCLLSFWCAALSMACNLENEGAAPLANELNFPIALEVSAPDPADGRSRFLYVASSNFDLRYATGSVVAIDLDLVAAADPTLPFVDPASVVRDQVLIGSLASGLALAPDGQHLYASVRGENALVYVDVLDGGSTLGCGGTDFIDNFERCGESREVGDESVATERREPLPPDPTGLFAGSIADLEPSLLGDYVVMSHRGGAASLFLGRAEGSAFVPRLVHVLPSLPGGLVNIRENPTDRTLWMPTHDVSADRPDNFVARVGIGVDATSPLDSYLFDAGTLVLSGVNDGEDTRDVAFETRADGSQWAYVLSRRPAALVIVDLDQTTTERMFVHDLVSLGFGPSRIELAQMPVGTSGVSETVVFVSCFDSGDVWAVVPRLRRVVSIARDLSGPFEIEVEVSSTRKRMYVADFTSSVVRVIDLENITTCLGGMVANEGTCEPVQLPSIGRPRPVRELL